MKKIYNRPTIDTIALCSSPMMTDPVSAGSGMGGHGGGEWPAPRPRTDKPF